MFLSEYGKILVQTKVGAPQSNTANPQDQKLLIFKPHRITATQAQPMRFKVEEKIVLGISD